MVVHSVPALKESNNVARSPHPRLVTARKPLMFQVTMRIRCWFVGERLVVIAKRTKVLCERWRRTSISYGRT